MNFQNIMRGARHRGHILHDSISMKYQEEEMFEQTGGYRGLGKRRMEKNCLMGRAFTLVIEMFLELDTFNLSINMKYNASRLFTLSFLRKIMNLLAGYSVGFILIR